MDTKDFEDIYSDDEPNELGSIQGNAKAIIDLISPIIDSPDVLCSRELDTINTFCIEAENNANYEDNWISRIVEIEDCIDTIKDNYPDIGEKVEELIESGCLMQSNIGSILGIYGNHAKQTFKYLLKKDLIHFLGTDTHRKDTIYPLLKKATKKIEKIIGKEKTEELIKINPQKILNNT